MADNERIEVTRNDADGRYEVSVDGQRAGFADFRDHTGDGGTVREMPHTVVDPAYGGRGLAGTMVKYALDDIREQGMRVRATCSYVDGYVTKHPEYEDLRESA